MFLFLISLIGSILGCVAFFITGSTTLLIIGAVLCAVDLLFGLLNGQSKTSFLQVGVVVVAMIIAGIIGYKLWVGAAIGLCISSLIMSIIGIIILLMAGASMGKNDDR